MVTLETISKIMNKEIVISLENISKKYFISKNILPFKIRNETTIEALNNVNIEFTVGDIVGIIGRNGSGKSTLLKILSQVTLPSTGKVMIEGKVVSAIEVAGGFNPDLSGIENIHLVSQIWGLSLKEVLDIEKTIIEFSNLSQFIYLPVKKFSTGMIGRLAASIIIHINADIYMFDEALNGSDQVFTQKLHQKLIELKAQKKTILFATHKITDLLSLCNKSLVIEKGNIIYNGNPFEAISTYRKIIQINNPSPSSHFNSEILHSEICFNNIHIDISNEHYSLSFDIMPIKKDIADLKIFVILNNSFDLPIGHTSYIINNFVKTEHLTCKFPNALLSDGIFMFSFALLLNSTQWYFFPRVMEFEAKNSEQNNFNFIPGISLNEAKWENIND
jgi:ABC-type polysaccharide/polyol phosphate transport system ATPase subunit